MKPPRFYCRPISGKIVEIIGSEAHHLAAVRRLDRGQTVELFDGQGGWSEAIITKLAKNQIVLQLGDIQIEKPPYQEKIIIASAIAKSDRFEGLITKCTELGVDRISPVRFERTAKLAHSEHISRRYQQLAIAAAKQSRRLFLPQIDQPQELGYFVEKYKIDYPRGNFLVGSLESEARSLISWAWPRTDVIAFIGPEGGLTEAETNILEQIRAQPIRLTDTVLRVETAAVSLAGILSAQRFAARQ